MTGPALHAPFVSGAAWRPVTVVLQTPGMGGGVLLALHDAFVPPFCPLQLHVQGPPGNPVPMTGVPELQTTAETAVQLYGPGSVCP